MTIMREQVISMAGPRQRQRLGRWGSDPGVRELRPDEVGNYLTEAEAAKLTGLTGEMLVDNRRRPRITNLSNPMSAMSRPAARFGVEPMYSREQCELYVQKANAPAPKLDVPTVSEAEAEEKGLVTLDQLAGSFGLSKYTLERYVRQDGDFPPVRALLSTDGKRGHPRKLRLLTEVDEWFTTWRANQEAV